MSVNPLLLLFLFCSILALSDVSAVSTINVFRRYVLMANCFNYWLRFWCKNLVVPMCDLNGDETVNLRDLLEAGYFD